MRIYESITEAVGGTPLIHLKKIEEALSLPFSLYAKIEYLNPGGSAKDRVAIHILKRAEEDGVIHPGRTTLIEPTSGNTGIGMALFAAAEGYKCIIVMPDNMSKERQLLMGAYGAKVRLTPGTLGMKGAIAEAERLCHELADSYLLGQFDNMRNPEAHYLATGPEIYEAMDGDIDVFVSAVGTGGTVSGVGAYLREKCPDVEIIGVEPKKSAVLSGGEAGAHKIQGIGAGFIPSVLNRDILDRVIAVSDEESFERARLLATKEGLLVGISSGAALSAALSLAGEEKYRGKRMVVLLPDSGERYLSVDGFVKM
ncbi:MAG: cysteine synthase A [Clostridia bacterium]|nr:cysteine synthase A [Clostridia bacterium]